MTRLKDLDRMLIARALTEVTRRVNEDHGFKSQPLGTSRCQLVAAATGSICLTCAGDDLVCQVTIHTLRDASSPLRCRPPTLLNRAGFKYRLALISFLTISHHQRLNQFEVASFVFYTCWSSAAICN